MLYFIYLNKCLIRTVDKNQRGKTGCHKTPAVKCIRSERSFATYLNGAVTQKANIPSEQWRGCTGEQDMESGSSGTASLTCLSNESLNF